MLEEATRAEGEREKRREVLHFAASYAFSRTRMFVLLRLYYLVHILAHRRLAATKMHFVGCFDDDAAYEAKKVLNELNVCTTKE